MIRYKSYVEHDEYGRRDFVARSCPSSPLHLKQSKLIKPNLTKQNHLYTVTSMDYV